MKETSFRDYVDVSFSNTTQHARRIITSPSLPAAYDAACVFIGQEVELTPTEIPHPDDTRLVVQNYFIERPAMAATARRSLNYNYIPYKKLL